MKKEKGMNSPERSGKTVRAKKEPTKMKMVRYRWKEKRFIFASME